MQFVRFGPDIPERLLQTHEDGRVVLFCGAGVSYPAGLPGFRDLTKALFDRLGETPSSIEQSAIDRKQFDTAIGLLESRIVGGRSAVRQNVGSILTPLSSSCTTTETHTALLRLSLSREGRYRLITTNFDRLFEQVIRQEDLSIKTFSAPLLPIPKNRLNGLVYLHGLLPSEQNGSESDDLVLSSGDFGRAYLTERWASRFVSELFRNYSVCFVGYSIDDPVLRYMMDALAADRLLGGEPLEMFAFGAYAKDTEAEKANEWRAKNVTPILYLDDSAHAHLHNTLIEWANTYRDGISGKERIVIQCASMNPGLCTEEDDFVGRMLWALSDRRALPAKRFAELDPPPSIDWLEPLAEGRFSYADLPRFGIGPEAEGDAKLVFSLLRRPAPYALAPWMSLVLQGSAISQWDDVMFHLASWLVRHLYDPKLILWVANRGETLHPQFSRMVERSLEDGSSSHPVQTLWRLILSGRIQKQRQNLEIYSWYDRVKREGLTTISRLQLRDILSPCVVLREPNRWWSDLDQKDVARETQIRDLVDWDIVLQDESAGSLISSLSRDAQWQDALSELLADITGLLRDTLDLMRVLGAADNRHDRSYLDQPSIAVHPQNGSLHGWTTLIELARDAWLASAEKSPREAVREAELWNELPYPIFRRLAFFAAGNLRLFPRRQALGWLLSDDHWWLWSVETQRESIRLLVAIAPHLDAPDLEQLTAAILQGPPREMFQDDAEPSQLHRVIDREIWLRLAKFRESGAKVGTDGDARFKALSEQYPMWRLAEDERDEFAAWTSDGSDLRTHKVTPYRRRALVEWLRRNPKSDIWDEDNWGERCRDDFSTAAAALLDLARNDEWPVFRWGEALQAWANEEYADRSWRYVASTLLEVSPDVLRELGHAISRWLEAVARTILTNVAGFFTLLHKVLALYRSDRLDANNDLVFSSLNHPVGHVTEASIHWWFRQSPKDNQMLPEFLRLLYSEICDSHAEGWRHGRVILAKHVIALYRVDREWTEIHLLPLFDWSQSPDEAKAAWQGFLMSPRLFRPLMDMIKSSFLAAADHYLDLGELGRQYANLLAFAGLEPGDTFLTTELADATKALPKKGLDGIADTLVLALESAGEQREEYWMNRVQPYFKTIWPKSRDIANEHISESFAKICIAARRAFPDAFSHLKNWLMPLDYPELVVKKMLESELPKRFPSESLDFLDRIIGHGRRWVPSGLRRCLEEIQSGETSLESDPRFIRLKDFLRLHDR